MLKAAIFFILLINSCVFFAQDITTIKGFAPAYVGKQVDVFQVSDFLSLKTERIASAIVHADSSFTVSFF